MVLPEFSYQIDNITAETLHQPADLVAVSNHYTTNAEAIVSRSILVGFLVPLLRYNVSVSELIEVQTVLLT